MLTHHLFFVTGSLHLSISGIIEYSSGKMHVSGSPKIHNKVARHFTVDDVGLGIYIVLHELLLLLLLLLFAF